MNFYGGQAATAQGESPTGGVANYYRSPDPKNWIVGAPMFAAVRYPEVYPGIDAVFHGNGDQLEYDLQIAPGADSDQIKVRLAAVEKLAVSANGGLDVTSRGEQWHFAPPRAFQIIQGKRQEVQSSYRLLSHDSFAFRIGKHNPKFAVTIDPVLQYAGIFAVNNSINANVVQVDAAGEMFIAGSTSATDYVVVNGQKNAGFNQEVYVTKLNAAGTQVLYSTYIPASGFSNVTSGALDSQGNFYVAGITSAPDFPLTSKTLGVCAQFCNAGFVLKLGTTGTIAYSTLLGSGQQLPHSIVVDASGSAYVGGISPDASLQTVNAFQSSYNNSICTSCSDAFFAKLTADGSAFEFASYFGPNENVPGSQLSVSAVALDTAGDFYIAGSGNADPALLNPLEFGSGDLFLAKFAPDGKTLLFSTKFGGTGITSETLAGMAVGQDGAIYLAGNTQSPDFPFTLGAAAHQLEPNQPGTGNTAMFAIAFDPTLTKLRYSTFLGWGSVGAIALDASDHLHVTGLFTSELLPLKNPIVSDLSIGGFITELDQTGNQVATTQYGGFITTQAPTAIAVDAAGSTYLAGTLSPQNTSFGAESDPILISSFQTFNYASYVAKIAPTSHSQLVATVVAPVMTLRNVGSADLHITNISLGAPLAIKSTTCGDTIAAGASCFLTVADANQNVAAGTVTIFTDAQPSGQSFSLVLPGVAKNSSTPVHVPDFIRFDRTIFHFPPQLIGTMNGTIDMHVSNAGLDSGNITEIESFGTAAVTSDCGTILPGQNCTAHVSLTGSFENSSIAVLYDDALRQDFFVQGLASETQFLASANSLEFGRQFVAGSAIPRVITITNTSNSAAAPTVSFTGDPGFAVTADNCGSVGPHQSCEVEISFVPTLSAEYRATALVSGPMDSSRTTLHGIGVIDSAITASPLWLNFQDIVAGVSPPTAFSTITLTNTSGAAVSILGITFSSPEFSETDTCQSPLQPSGTCIITVAFAPQSLGPKSESMTVQFSGGVRSQVISVSGNGVPPLSLSTNSLDFGFNNPVGVASPIKTVNLGNGRQGAPQAYTLSIDGDFQIAQNPCANPLPGFQGCFLGITFQPTKTGFQTGHLTVGFPGNNVTAVVSLTGSTDAGPAFTAPPSLDFGATTTGTEIARSVMITNTGAGDLLLNSYVLQNGSPDEFIANAGQCAVIHAGGSCALNLTFLAIHAGPQQTTLLINDNAPGSPHSVSLTGQASDPVTFALANVGHSVLTAKAGDSATFNLSAASLNGFNGTVQLSCSGGPPNSACSAQPSSLTLTANSTVMFSITVQTQKTATLVPLPWGKFAFVVAACLPFTFRLRSHPRFFARRAWIIHTCVLACVLMIGCGGGGSASMTPAPTPVPTPAPPSAPPPPPSTSYPIVVTAASGAQTQSLHLTLNVQ